MLHAAMWRTSHDTATPPEVILLGSNAEGGGCFSILDAHHGVETSSGTLPYPMTQVHKPTAAQHETPSLGRPAQKPS